MFLVVLSSFFFVGSWSQAAFGETCGGKDDITCDTDLLCALYDLVCDPACGDKKCVGVCVTPDSEGLPCGNDGDLDCQDGYTCIDDPSDDCSVNCDDLDCSGICAIIPDNSVSCEEDSEQWSVDYTGNSGKFKLTNDCEDNLWIMITMNSFTEYDSDGKKTNNKQTSFAGNNFEWHTNEDSEYNGKHAIKNTYSGTMTISSTDIPFNLTTYFFTSDSTFNVSDDDYYNNGIKWTIELFNGWPFSSNENTLVLDMNVKVGGKKQSGSKSDKDAKWEYKYDQGFIIEAPEECILDGDENNPSAVAIEVDAKNSVQTDITFAFGYFESSLEYDPIIYYDDDVAYSIKMNGFYYFMVFIISFLYFV